MGSHHLRALRRGTSLELVGIVELDARRHETLVREHGVPCSMSLEALLAVVGPRPDCALVCTPDRLHAPEAMRCLENGLHVLVEKPMCPELEPATALLDAFDRRGMILASGMVERHNPAWRAFLEHVSDLGELRRLEIQRSGRTPADRSSGILKDLAIHDLDLLWSWLGPRDLELESRNGGRSAILRGGAEPTIHLEARWDDGPTCRCWTLEGSGGTMALDLQARAVILSLSDGTRTSLQVPREDPLELEHRQFAQVIREGTTWSRLAVPRHLETIAFCERYDTALSAAS
jgi:predicted dehydrogenase